MAVPEESRPKTHPADEGVRRPGARPGDDGALRTHDDDTETAMGRRLREAMDDAGVGRDDFER